MLITLQSNNDNDASDFVNYFKETVMIEPKSELTLVNISYKFENGITIIAGQNDTFRVSIGTDNDFGTCTVLPGEYVTDESFATACETALHGLINTLPYWKTQAFPLSSQTFTIEGASTDKLKITLQYDPQEWDNSLILNATAGNERKQVFTDTTGMTPEFNKGIIKRITAGNTDNYGVDDWNSGTGIERANTNVIWATARDTNEAIQHGKIAWKAYRSDSVEWVVGVVDGDLPSTSAQWLNGSTVLPLAVRCMANGNLRISEKNASGVLSTIIDNVPVADFEDIEIHFDQMTPSSGETYAKYYVGGTEVIIDPSAVRWVLRPGLDLVPCGSFKTRNVEREIIDGGATYFVDNVATNIGIDNAGSGYINGEIVEAEFVSGSKTTLLATTNASGVIQSLTFQEHGGNMAPAGEGPLTLTGLMSGATSASAIFADAKQSVDITNAGTNYNANDADIVADGITYTDAITITSVSVGGVIEDFTWNNLFTNGTITVGDVVEVHEGGHTDARLTINALNAKSNIIYSVKTDVIAREDVDEPLGLHNRATFRPSAGFTSTTGLGNLGPAPATPLTATSTTEINNGREDTTMLVNIEEFMLKSICKEGGVQKAIASVPYGLTQPYFESGDPIKVDGEFYYEPYNTLYHDLSNPSVENHNQLRVRITDAVGNPVSQLKHPTTLTLDLRPRAK